jgi:hypothetical protein
MADRRAYDTGASAQVQADVRILVDKLEKKLDERNVQVNNAMSDFQADGIDEQYRAVEKQWKDASTQVNQVIDMLRKTMDANDGIASKTMQRANAAVRNM